MDFSELFLLFTCLSIIFKTGEPIKCLVCSSLNNRWCEAGRLNPQKCEPSMQYCITYTGEINQSGTVIFRDCYHQNRTEVCTIKRVKGRDMKGCYTVCDTDACNGGPKYAANSTSPAEMPRAGFLLASLVLGLSSVVSHTLLLPVWTSYVLL